MSGESYDPVVALVCNAIGYGVMMALEGREELLTKLRRAPAGNTMFDILLGDAEGFVKSRADLVAAVVGEE